MKLAIDLDAGSKTQAFHPGDRVRGALIIRHRAFKELPSIEAIFKGRVRVVRRPQTNTPAEYGMHTLFEESQEIAVTSPASATESSTGSLGKSKPNYSAPFEFTFPSSCTSCARQLPPTLYSFSSLLSIRVEYIIVLALRHRIVCGVKSTKKIQRELSFRSEPGTTILTQSTAGYLPANTLCPRLNETLRVADKTCPDYPGWLPPYTSSLLLEARLPSPPVLTTGRATPMQLVLQTPPELLGGDNIYLRSITVQLKSSVIATSGSITCSATESTPFWSSKGRIHIDKERFELDSGAWTNLGMSYALPTCSSCALNLSHTVEVTAGISKGEGLETHYCSTSVGVLVMDPPPDYSSQVPVPEETFQVARGEQHLVVTS